MPNSQLTLQSAPFAILALLLPVGLILTSVAGLGGRRPARSAVTGLGAFALSVVTFWACGFAFHFGGIGLVSELPGLEGLVWEWASPLNLDWGVLGLRGFFLLREAANPTALMLFLASLPSLAVAVILPSLSLRQRLPGWMASLGALVMAAFVYPAIANWFSGGGWLMHVGRTLGLGHGYIDLAGLSTATLSASLPVLLGAVLFGRRLPPLLEGERPLLPAVHLPVLAALGAMLVVTGAMGQAMSWLQIGVNPIDGSTLSSQALGLAPARAMVNIALAAAGGSLVPSLYTWFVTGAPDSLMAARGAVAGTVSIAAASAFVAPWAALALGAITGLLLPLISFLVRHVLRIDDPIGALPLGITGGILGILAPGVLSDGLAGLGWNGMGRETYLGVTGQGVTGFLPAPGLAPDWPAQLHAQLVGLAAVAAFTAVVIGSLFLVLRVLLFLWRAIPAPADDDPESVSE